MKKQATKERSRGTYMTISTLIFFAGIVLCVIALLIYMRAEDTPFHKTMTKIGEVEGELNSLKTAHESEVSSLKGVVEDLSKKLANAEWQFTQLQAIVKDTDESCEQAQDHCARLREGQIRIQEEISKKRPVHTHEAFKGPIEIEILTPTKRYPARATKKTATRKKATTKKKTTRKKATTRKAPTRKKKTKRGPGRPRKKTTRGRSSSSATPPPVPKKAMGRGVASLIGEMQC